MNPLHGRYNPVEVNTATKHITAWRDNSNEQFPIFTDAAGGSRILLSEERAKAVHLLIEKEMEVAEWEWIEPGKKAVRGHWTAIEGSHEGMTGCWGIINDTLPMERVWAHVVISNDDDLVLSTNSKRIFGEVIQSFIDFKNATGFPDEPLEELASVYDGEGSMWVRHKGMWTCLDVTQASRLWSSLVEEFGPITLEEKS